MNTFLHNARRIGEALLLLIFFVALTTCSRLRKGVKALQTGELEKAEMHFKGALRNPKESAPARGHLARLDAQTDPSPETRIAAAHTVCQTMQSIQRMPLKQRVKLARLGSDYEDFRTARTTLERIIIQDLTIFGTIPQMSLLLDSAGCWETFKLDTLTDIVVNKNIDPEHKLDTRLDDFWEGTEVDIREPEELRATPGSSYRAPYGAPPHTLTYAHVSTINERFTGNIVTDNYQAFRRIHDDIWKTFQRDESYCDMAVFKSDYPEHRIARDCWFDAAAAVLCQDLLRPLLAFHRDHPHTALDQDICKQITYLATVADDRELLDRKEREQLADIELMFDLWQRAKCCREPADAGAFVEQAAYLAEKYPGHHMVYLIAQKVIECPIYGALGAQARAAIATLQPLFPDAEVCPTAFDFQVGKQAWFKRIDRLLNTDDHLTSPVNMTDWNTPDHDEYDLVSWGGNREVFFVRRSRDGKTTNVMTSLATPQGWTEPKPVKTLSLGATVRLLSISSGGRQMLLSVRGKLRQAYRPDVGRPWLQPSPLEMNERFAGSAWLSPDDSTLLVSIYRDEISPLLPPKTDLARMPLGADGTYRRAYPLDASINLPLSNESDPLLALGGRVLFYTTDEQEHSMGKRDVMSAGLADPRDWSTLSEPVNVGLPFNTVGDDDGISYFSEYGGEIYFHRLDACNGDLNIHSLRLTAGIFPANAMRTGGIVIDENDAPVGGSGFMEFTANYNLKVHSEPITPEGTYVYTVADSTAVVRLFPEVPGYYSENDAVHHLEDVVPGEIMRDTFRLTSFEHLRKNFRLRHSTFVNGTARFDQPDRVYPELTRLAKIAIRMGADLELRGHTDDVGTAMANTALSRRRAETVKAFLVDKCGFPATRIYVSAYGATRPLCEEDTATCRARNRRIEVVFRMPELGEE